MALSGEGPSESTDGVGVRVVAANPNQDAIAFPLNRDNDVPILPKGE